LIEQFCEAKVEHIRCYLAFLLPASINHSILFTNGIKPGKFVKDREEPKEHERRTKAFGCLIHYLRLQQEAILRTLIAQIRLLLLRQVQISGHLITLSVGADARPAIQHSRDHG
jgi:hypothetical protein